MVIPAERFGFGMALEIMETGRMVTRDGWRGAVDGVFLVPGSKFTVSRAPLLGILPEGAPVEYHPHLDMKCGNEVRVWTPDHGDLLAKDWRIVK